MALRYAKRCKITGEQKSGWKKTEARNGRSCNSSPVFRAHFFPAPFLSISSKKSIILVLRAFSIPPSTQGEPKEGRGQTRSQGLLERGWGRERGKELNLKYYIVLFPSQGISRELLQTKLLWFRFRHRSQFEMLRWVHPDSWRPQACADLPFPSGIRSCAMWTKRCPTSSIRLRGFRRTPRKNGKINFKGGVGTCVWSKKAPNNVDSNKFVHVWFGSAVQPEAWVQRRLGADIIDIDPNKAQIAQWRPLTPTKQCTVGLIHEWSDILKAVWWVQCWADWALPFFACSVPSKSAPQPRCVHSNWYSWCPDCTDTG